MSTLESLYQQALPHLKEIEKNRKPYFLYRRIGIGTMIAILGTFIIPLTLELILQLFGVASEDISHIIISWHIEYGIVAVFQILPWIFMMAMGISYHFSSKIAKEQQKLLPELIKEVNPNWQLKYKFMENKKVYASGFFDSGEKKPKISALGWGVIEGEIEGVPVEFTDIKVFPKLHWYQMIPVISTAAILIWYFITNIRLFFSKHEGDDFFYNFSGLFFIADFNKKIHGFTLVLPDNYEKYIGFMAPTVQEFMRKKQGKLAYLEDPRFEKEFVVYSTDQIEARYILTPDLMEKIVELKQKLARPLLLSFRGDKMYLGLLDRDGIFKVSLSQNVVRPEAIEKPYQNLLACIEIVKELKLNTKVWGKTETKTSSLEE